jgi:hypothetical protein
MTDFGQLFGISKTVVVGYFRNNVIITVVSLIFLAVGVLLNIKKGWLKKKVMIVIIVVWVFSLLSTKYVAPYFLFRTHQYNAEYVKAKDAGGYLEDDDVVFAIDLNGETKAYPRKFMWQTHVVGGDFGDEEVVFTYCVLTNLPTPYMNSLDGEPMDLKVLAQTNNNLLLWETNSGEIIQQINHTCEFSSRKLEPVPVLEMTWKNYKKLFPEGEIFYNEFNTLIEKGLDLVFSLDKIYYGDKWMFNTANLDDKRLPSKEQVIGVKDGDKAVVFTKDFIKKRGVYNTKVGSKSVVLAYFPEYETIAAFNRDKGGEEVTVEDIDIWGNTPEHGQLERAYIYNSVLWAVWAHYHPETEILK